MQFGSTRIDLEQSTYGDIEGQVARALASELVGDAYHYGQRFAVDPDRPNVLTDGVREVAVFIRHGLDGYRVTLRGSLVFDLETRGLFVRATAALERGPIIIANVVRRRILRALDEALPSVKARVERERASSRP